MQYQDIISTITLRIQRLSTNNAMQTAWAAALYTFSRGGGPGKPGETQMPKVNKLDTQHSGFVSHTDRKRVLYCIVLYNLLLQQGNNHSVSSQFPFTTSHSNQGLTADSPGSERIHSFIHQQLCELFSVCLTV